VSSPPPCCILCGCRLASDTVRAGADLCSLHRGTDSLPLSVEDVLDLGLAEHPLAVLALDPRSHFHCGHPRAGNTIVERRRDGRLRERCRLHKEKRDRRRAA
jgi:hypothetical protein